MAVFLLAFLIIALSLAGLAIGVLFGRSGLKGSCGGIACAACGRCSQDEDAQRKAGP